MLMGIRTPSLHPEYSFPNNRFNSYSPHKLKFTLMITGSITILLKTLQYTKS